MVAWTTGEATVKTMSPAGTAPDERRDPKIRDAYVRARFPGLARGSADLGRADRVIEGARQYFSEGRPARALELLEMATRERPDLASLWVARLELLLLADRDDEFLEVAKAFVESHPRTGLADEMALLGQSLRATVVDGGRAILAGATRGWFDPTEPAESARLAAEIHRLIAPAATRARAPTTH